MKCDNEVSDGWLINRAYREQLPKQNKTFLTHFLGIDAEISVRDGSEATDKAGSFLEERCDFGDAAEDVAADRR